MSGWNDLSSWQSAPLDEEHLKRLASKSCPSCGREYEGFFVQCPSDQITLQDVPSPCGSLAKHYECGRKIGLGSLFEVYEAKDTESDKQVVVKALRRDTECEQRSMKRFEQEQMVSGAVKHPNIASTLAFGALPDQYTLRPFMIVERIDGIGLGEAYQQWERCPREIAIELMSQIASAMDFAHSLGAVHGDLKPNNIFLTTSQSEGGNDKKRCAMIVDFGVYASMFTSRDAGRHAGFGSNLTSSALYTAPEVSKGTTPNAAADIYSLGCLFYEMLAGKAPFSGTSAFEVAYAHQNDEPEALPDDVNSALREAIMSCLIKDPVKRLDKVATLLSALESRAVAS